MEFYASVRHETLMKTPAIIPWLVLLLLCGCLTSRKPTVAIVLSRFSPIAASLSSSQVESAIASLSAEMAARGFVVTRDPPTADYVLFARFSSLAGSPSGVRPEIVSLKPNPKPRLTPELPPSGLAQLAEDAS